ncbi:hypothetical protein [Synechococcus sp. MIT S9504]|uniref:hypothetical protein n=1 Tax=Synechococcus sp. MIT S9504 TaxID=1801628 RepID=UPI0012E97A29|nr:hypothetical protein [Synechococcus sp. MIT S9504]
MTSCYQLFAPLQFACFNNPFHWSQIGEVRFRFEIGEALLSHDGHLPKMSDLDWSSAGCATASCVADAENCLLYYCSE